MSAWSSYLRRGPVATLPLPPARRRVLYLALFLALGLSFYLYVDSLSIPFLQEDSSHIRWLAPRGILEPFLSAKDAPAYRPLGKAIVKTWYLVLGHHDRAWLRFHNIVFNALNIALVGVIGSWIDRGRGRYLTGGLAAIFFAVLPFAYQAIPWINNFFYPLINLLLLAAIACYWQARVRDDNRLLAAALFFCFLAPFEIEYGAVVSGLFLAVELTLWAQGRQARPWLLGPALALLMNGAFVLRWLTVPKESYSFGWPTPERIGQIGVYYLQGLTFPLSPLAEPLRAATPLSDLAAIVLVGLPILLALAVYLWRQPAPAKRVYRPVLLFGLLWFGLVALPAFVVLDFDYVINSPRLLYPAGPGIAWLWGGLLAAFLTRPGRPRWRWALALLFVLLVGGQSVRFVRRLVDLYHLAETPYHQLAELAQEGGPDQPLLVVNFPSWMTPPERDFALGNHGIQLLPEYIHIGDLVYAYTDQNYPVAAVQFNNLQTSQPYYYGLLGPRLDYEGLRPYLAADGPVYITDYSPEAIELRYAGRLGTPAPDLEATFAGGVDLALVALDTGLNPVELTLAWSLSAPPAGDLTVFVHLYGPDGALVAQADGYPLGGLAPFWLFDAGQTLSDQRRLPLPAGAPAGPYRLGVGLYDPAAGTRVPAFQPDGTPWPDDVAILATFELAR